VFGKKEVGERFLSINLFQGKALRNNSGLIGSGGQSSQGDKVLDPTIFSVAYKRNRFYLFSTRMPVEIESDKHQLLKRDIINEKPTKEESQLLVQPTNTELAKQVLYYYFILNK